MNRAFHLSRLALFGLATATSASFADDFHYVNMLIGDRASGLAGAYTAVSDDATGLFYNPAGIVYTQGRSLSASVNAYHMSNRSYKDVLGGGDWNRESSSLLPNFFGVVQPLGRGVAGFSYAVTDSIQENLDQRFTTPGIDDYVININNNDATYKLGPSFAMEVRDGLSVGATLYAHFRNTETVVNQVITGILGSDYEWTTGYLQSSETGVEPIIGVMWSPLDKVALGATLRQVTILSSDFESQSTCISDFTGSACTSTTPLTSFDTSTGKRSYPLTLTVGASYFPSDRFMYTADFVYYNEASGDDSAHGMSPFRTKPATWNASAGVEYYYSSAWALRGGIYTNNANTPKISSGSNQPEHVDMVGFSASVSRFTRNSSITGGLSYSVGEGDAQVISGVPAVQDVSVENTTFFLSTSYNY